jgi:hypothetical protein
MADAATFLEELQPVIDGMPEEDRGYIVGEVYASAATTVVTTAATGGIGTVPVIAAVAVRTRTMANALLTARVLNKIPEGRRDAFRQTVERLRDRSDRLEVDGENKALMAATYESYCSDNEGDRGWEAFRKMMVDARQWRDEGKITGEDIKHALRLAVQDEYMAGRMITISQLRQEIGGLPNPDRWMRDLVMENHHSVPKNQILRRMLELKYPTRSSDEIALLRDQLEGGMPGIPLDKELHTKGVSALHRFIDAELRHLPEDPSIVDYRTAMNNAYDRFSETLSGPDREVILRVKDRANDWLNSDGVDLR